MTILVTGGAGYIGSHTCKALAAAGYRPVCFDNFVHGHEWAVQWGPSVNGSILDENAIASAFEQYRPSAVIHLAAFTDVGESVADPGKYYQNNVAGTISLLEAMRRFDCPIIVLSSTCATYGAPQTIPIPEDHPQEPINPYGRSKLMIERILADCARAYGLKYAALRYFNAAGADPNGDLGEDHDPETHLIPLVIQAARGMRAHVDIYGTDYPTPDGTCIRDYIHVTDLADAHLLALQRLAAGDAAFALNLGTGVGQSVLEVIGAVERVSGRNVPAERCERRPGDLPVLVASCERAQTYLGWSPRLSDFERIIETAWRWHGSGESTK